jgi:hypothetical protein
VKIIDDTIIIDCICCGKDILKTPKSILISKNEGDRILSEDFKFYETDLHPEEDSLMTCPICKFNYLHSIYKAYKECIETKEWNDEKN